MISTPKRASNTTPMVRMPMAMDAINERRRKNAEIKRDLDNCGRRERGAVQEHAITGFSLQALIRRNDACL